MADIDLTQSEADNLIAMHKIKTTEEEWEYPVGGQRISIPLTSADKRENFILDLSRGKIDLLKGTYQNRARQILILVRLDFGGKPHTNPDGEEIGSPHLHIYREGYGDKWATPVPTDTFSSMDDLWKTLEDFMHFCNISEPPNIGKGLFI